ncbi:MAG: hypothetical protein RLZZ09_1006 [Pseudomonadota bacterium]
MSILDAETLHEPVFIGGFRSGTTLLVNLLGLHRDLMPWFETKAFCEALRLVRVLSQPRLADLEASLVRPQNVPGFSVDAVASRMLCDFRDTEARILGVQPSGKAEGERYPHGHDYVAYSARTAEAAVQAWQRKAIAHGHPDAESVTDATGQLIAGLGNSQLAGSGKSRWINKTPEIIRFMPELRAALGPCRFIMMVRDGRQVVSSAARLGWAGAAEIAVWWKAVIEEAREGGSADPARYFELRYEDLIADPAPLLNQVFAFLGLEPQGETVVDNYKNILGIGSLMEGSSKQSRSGPEEFVLDSKIEKLIDAEFNASLGY